MLQYTQTTVFNTNAQAIVNTVNCVGVMGAGLALEFKLRFPQMYTDYVSRCKNKNIKIGKVNLYHDQYTPYIINFPTKNHWKYPSNLQWIEAGLIDFVQQYSQWGITSVAFPKLGCDRGGLNWSDVDLLLIKYLNNLPNLDVYICLDTEINAQGLEKQMLDLLNSKNCQLSDLKLSSSLIDNLNNSLPIKRLKYLFNIPNFKKEAYQTIFQLLSSLLQEKLATEYYLDTKIFKIQDARIPLVMFLKLLGFSYQEMSQLKLKSLVLVKQSNDFWGLIYLEKQIIITSNIWEQMKIDLNRPNGEYPLISYRNNPQKHLQPTSIRKLISRGKKLINHFSIDVMTTFNPK
jgi:O-acetyl-ADP-ribose deacetylase (regulator of RNase III)